MKNKFSCFILRTISVLLTTVIVASTIQVNFTTVYTLSNSEAKVNLFQSGRLIATFNVPASQGLGNFWNVFSIKNGKFVIKNTVTSSPDINYSTD